MFGEKFLGKRELTSVNVYGFFRISNELPLRAFVILGILFGGEEKGPEVLVTSRSSVHVLQCIEC